MCKKCIISIQAHMTQLKHYLFHIENPGLRVIGIQSRIPISFDAGVVSNDMIKVKKSSQTQGISNL